MIYYANVYYIEPCGLSRGYWSGESPNISIKTNVRELQGELVEFIGDSRESVINQIIETLKARGFNGNLRINQIK